MSAVLSLFIYPHGSVIVGEDSRLIECFADGFGGADKVFLMEFSMPNDEKAGFDGDVPAIVSCCLHLFPLFQALKQYNISWPLSSLLSSSSHKAPSSLSTFSHLSYLSSISSLALLSSSFS